MSVRIEAASSLGGVAQAASTNAKAVAWSAVRAHFRACALSAKSGGALRPRGQLAGIGAENRVELTAF